MEKIKSFLSSVGKYLAAKVGPFFRSAAKPALKSLAISYAKQECARQAKNLKEGLATGDNKILMARIDKLQVSLKARILNIPFAPVALKEKLEKIINAGIDRFQAKLAMGLETHGFDFAVDMLATELGEYIESQIKLL